MKYKSEFFGCFPTFYMLRNSHSECQFCLNLAGKSRYSISLNVQSTFINVLCSVPSLDANAHQPSADFGSIIKSIRNILSSSKIKDKKVKEDRKFNYECSICWQ